MLGRGLELRSFDKTSRHVEFVASTDAVDSYEEIVEQDWQLERYRANPVVLFGHDSRDLPIGKATFCEVVQRNGRMQLECTIQIASAKANPLAEQVWNSIEEGTLRAVSVGFIPGEVRAEKRSGRQVLVLSKNELIEISVVPIPANPEALAKMKAKAFAAATENQQLALPAVTENTMDEKQMNERVAKADAEKGHAEKVLTDTQKELTSTKAALAAVEATVKAVETDRDAQKARAEKAEAGVIDAEVEALVGKKIAPAEKADMVELAKTNRPLFERIVKARPEMKLLGGVSGADKVPATDLSDSNGEALAALIA